jgi:ParB family transcriptional regulator, chromosome partitioning protein
MAAKKSKSSASPKAPRAKRDKGAAPTRGKRKPKDAGSTGLAPADAASGGADADALMKQVAADGGVALAHYRDPLFGKTVVVAILPVGKVTRTAYQRDVSEAHVDKLVDAMQRTGAYLDPIIAVRDESDAEHPYHSPNGGHRLSALTRMGAKSVTALVIPDARLAFKILALNTEKAHALKDKALETVRMLRALAQFGGSEGDFAGELEDPALVTLGAAYEKRPRLSGSAYHPLLKRIDAFIPGAIAKAVDERARRADQLLAFDDAVAPLVQALKDKGFDSPGLRAVVLSRVAPLPRRGETIEGSFDEVMERVTQKARSYDVTKIDLGAVAAAGGHGGGSDE